METSHALREQNIHRGQFLQCSTIYVARSGDPYCWLHSNDLALSLFQRSSQEECSQSIFCNAMSAVLIRADDGIVDKHGTGRDISVVRPASGQDTNGILLPPFHQDMHEETCCSR
jgi:hypothetical protein